MLRATTRAFTSLRAWLAHLAETDRLAIAREGLALRHELAALAQRLDGEKATFFPAPGGLPVPVVSGLISQRRWIAEALGVDEASLLERFRAASLAPLPWHEVDTAPVQAVVSDGPVDLADWPIPTHSELDHGPYISAALLIARNPATGVQNVSINRCQVAGPNRLGVLLLPRHAHHFYQQAEAAGEPLSIALVIGVDPATLLASQAIAPLDQDELEIAGALLGTPLDVVKCRTSDIRVPALAEIVLEGRLLPAVREPEGPFGEFPQYYGPRSDKHVIEIDTITHRENPIFHTILGGGLDHLILGAIPREATILAHLRRTFTTIRDVHLTMGGVGRYHLVVQVDPLQRGEAKNIIMAAFGAHYDVKRVVVVDADVDIHDPREVEWALATRFQADQDVIVAAGAQGSKLDPSADDGLSAKMGMDATIPPGSDPFTFTRIRTPGAADLVPEQALDPHVDVSRWLGDG